MKIYRFLFIDSFMYFSASDFLAPYLHQFSAVVQVMNFFSAILEKFAINQNLEKNAETAPAYGAI